MYQVPPGDVNFYYESMCPDNTEFLKPEFLVPGPNWREFVVSRLFTEKTCKYTDEFVNFYLPYLLHFEVTALRI